MNKMIMLLLFVLLSLVGLFYTNISLTLVCIGMVAAFIGTLAGGGGLITLPAMMLVGIPIQTSIATNKFSTGISSLSSIFSTLSEGATSHIYHQIYSSCYCWGDLRLTFSGFAV